VSISDQDFADNWAGMKIAGLLRGAYHFFHPSSDPVAQAANFSRCLANANGGSQNLASGDLPVALDIEVTDGVSTDSLIAGVTSWLQAIEAATGKKPIIYTYVSFWKSSLGNPTDLSTFPLWIAQLDVASPTVPGGWQNWMYWQFDQQPLSGVPSPVVDLDAFNGTLADLQGIAA
jgi:lysozyme